MNVVLDGKIAREEKAKDEATEKKRNHLEVARKQPREVASVRSHEVAGVQSTEVASVQPKHLQYNHLIRTPSNNCSDSSETLHSYSPDKMSDDGNIPLPIPQDEAQAEAMMDEICDGRTVSPPLRGRLKSMLGDGILTPRMATNILGPKREVAA